MKKFALNDLLFIAYHVAIVLAVSFLPRWVG